MTKTDIIAKVSGTLADGTAVTGTRPLFSDGAALLAHIAGSWRPVSARPDGSYGF